jgi:hypothetical protein
MQALPRHVKERPEVIWPESQGCLAAIFSRILDVGHIVSYPYVIFSVFSSQFWDKNPSVSCKKGNHKHNAVLGKKIDAKNRRLQCVEWVSIVPRVQDNKTEQVA